MIKEISVEHIPECVKVIKESFTTIANQFGITIENAPRFTAFSTSEEKLTKQFVDNHRPMYAYFENEKIIGYYSLSPLENNECELNNLCVLPDHRHTGIGLTLLNDACTNAKKLGRTKMMISIVEENKVLRKWYEANGFIHTDTKKFAFFPFTCGYLQKNL